MKHRRSCRFGWLFAFAVAINLESLFLVRRLVAGKEPDGLAGIFGAGQKRF